METKTHAATIAQTFFDGAIFVNDSGEHLETLCADHSSFKLRYGCDTIYIFSDGSAVAVTETAWDLVIDTEENGIYRSCDDYGKIIPSGWIFQRGTECAYCGHIVPELHIPESDDDAGWKNLASSHDKSCEWISTRAHQSEFNITR